MMDKIIIINESTSQSIISDIFTYAGLFGGFFINRYFLGDSVFIQIFIAAMYFLIVLGTKKTKKMTPLEALAYLSEKNKREGGI